MERPDIFHDNPYTYVAKLFNMVQACRTDLEILKNNEKYIKEIDFDFVKVVDALSREVHQVFDRKEMN